MQWWRTPRGYCKSVGGGWARFIYSIKVCCAVLLKTKHTAKVHTWQLGRPWCVFCYQCTTVQSRNPRTKTFQWTYSSFFRCKKGPGDAWVTSNKIYTAFVAFLQKEIGNAQLTLMIWTIVSTEKQALVAQSVERRSHNPKVASRSLPGANTFLLTKLLTHRLKSMRSLHTNRHHWSKNLCSERSQVRNLPAPFLCGNPNLA